MKIPQVGLLLIGALLLFASCVPNRKVTYLQKGDVKKKNLPKDTVVRAYEIQIREYRIQPLDLLSIRIESLTPEEYDFISKLYPMPAGGGGGNLLLNSFLVDNNGEIEFPVAGKIKFSGLSVFEAQEAVQKAFKDVLKNPVARVRLLNFRFSVLGEVNTERTVISENTRVTMMEAIGLAGGLTDLADREKVKVIRQVGSESEVFYLNLLDENLIAADHYFIQQNDVIIVPPLRQRPFRKYFGQNITLLVSTISIILLTATLLK